MKRIIQGCLLLLAALLLPTFTSADTVTAEAAVSKSHVEVAQRELKKDRDYHPSDIYARAHHIIYGSKAPVGPGGRTRIAVIVNGAETLVVEDRVKNDIYAQLRQKFPREDFALMKGTDVNTKLIQSIEDRYAKTGNGGDRVTITSSSMTIERDGSGWNGTVPTEHIFGAKTVSLDDIVKAGSECNYDYVFLLTLDHAGFATYKENWVNDTTTSDVWIHVRFVDVNNGTYLYRNDIAARGKVHNGYLNGRLFERSVHNGVNEAINDITVTED